MDATPETLKAFSFALLVSTLSLMTRLATLALPGSCAPTLMVRGSLHAQQEPFQQWDR